MDKLFPNEEVIVSEYFDVHQDWEVPIPGFFILAAKRKVRSIAEFTDDESKEFIFLVRSIRQGMKEVLDINDVYIFQNEDTEHNFHLWIFPRYDWMEKFGRKIESVRPIMLYAQKEMIDEKTAQEVKTMAAMMNDYMKENFNK
ncbi:MAG: diadenosine tetraphosphate hydrolase [Parcubacteria group bacterium]|jgi:diadenosine tetraphosphate (Ap4A) HIT family hydrolase|nr:diadenosine tetraphosphate hydrolase [Parcubacteria group bacterium]